ncbi:putative signal peptidase complex catalytic subunit SEC11 [Xylariaceae sp. FL0594]|nr:putative signal peptidase complex catalytic subunit SEC11 [Xylariaceae sp. FL0594]
MTSDQAQRPSRRLGGRRKTFLLLSTILDVLLPLSAVFMAWKGLSVSTNSSFPVVVVISESMAPTFHRGDLLFLWNWTTTVEPGDIPVVWFDNNPLPMVHRIIRTTQESGTGSQTFLTKGDNNHLDDVALYPGNRTTVDRSEVVGFVRGYIPFLGWTVIAFKEFYWVKLLVGGVGVAVLSLG